MTAIVRAAAAAAEALALVRGIQLRWTVAERRLQVELRRRQASSSSWIARVELPRWNPARPSRSYWEYLGTFAAEFELSAKMHVAHGSVFQEGVLAVLD